MFAQITDSRGVTLPELLVGLVLFGLVSSAIYNVYLSHNKSYVTQDQGVEMQQNLRAALFMMAREIRMNTPPIL